MRAGGKDAGGRESPTPTKDNKLERLRRARRTAANAFRHVAGHVSQLTQVHNLAVLHTSMDALRSDQAKLASRLEMLVKVCDATAKSVHHMSQRQRLQNAATSLAQRPPLLGHASTCDSVAESASSGP